VTRKEERDETADRMLAEGVEVGAESAGEEDGVLWEEGDARAEGSEIESCDVELLRERRGLARGEGRRPARRREKEERGPERRIRLTPSMMILPLEGSTNRSSDIARVDCKAQELVSLLRTSANRNEQGLTFPLPVLPAIATLSPGCTSKETHVNAGSNSGE